MKRRKVYELIDGERKYQDALQVGPDGRTDGEPKSVGDYLTLIRCLSARADEAYYGKPGNEPSLDQVRKIAAVAIQCMEVHGAPPRMVMTPIS